VRAGGAAIARVLFGAGRPQSGACRCVSPRRRPSIPDGQAIRLPPGDREHETYKEEEGVFLGSSLYDALPARARSVLSRLSYTRLPYRGFGSPRPRAARGDVSRSRTSAA